MMNKNANNLIAFDSTPSKRRKDENGFLHIDECPITKEQVVGYYGIEIPGWQGLGLDPKKLYSGYRPAEEIIKAAETFNGLPLLLRHAPESANKPTDQRIGSTGTSAKWAPPFLLNTLNVTTKDGVDAIEADRIKQLSASYRYDPDFTPGEFDGVQYDFVMRNLRGNHHAVVEKARGGEDMIVADSAPEGTEGSDKVERKEVALADAIEKLAEGIKSLHKIVDGKVVDVNEDNAPESKEKGESDSTQENKDMPNGKDEKKAEDGKKMAIDEIIDMIKSLPAADSDKIKAAFASDSDEDKEKADKKADDEDKADKEEKKAEDSEEKKAHADKKAEDEDKEEKEDKAMDSAAIFAELAARNKLAEQLSSVIGNFAFDSMSLSALAAYAAKELKLDAPKGHEMTAVSAYLKAHKPEKTVIFAADSAPGKGSKGADLINKKYGG